MTQAAVRAAHSLLGTLGFKVHASQADRAVDGIEAFIGTGRRMVMKVKGPPEGGPGTSIGLCFGLVGLRLGQHDAPVEVERQGSRVRRRLPSWRV
jgi:hypothetical protein